MSSAGNRRWARIPPCGGTTIIQVTHSETNVAGNRVVELADGWVVNERAAW